MKKQTTFLAVLSAAAVMSFLPSYFAPTAGKTAYAASYGWVLEDGETFFYDEDGYRVTDSWKKNEDDWYYLGEDGEIVTNKKVDEYLTGPDGKMVKNSWAELKNTEDMDSPETPASYWYYFGEDGKSLTSQWKKLENKWYYFDENGHMLTGKQEIDDSTYYLGNENDGQMKTGWIKLEENASAPGDSEGWFYFNSDGKMVETQYDKRIDGHYYTFIDGRMQDGWVKMPGTAAEATAETAGETEADNAKTDSGRSTKDHVGNYQYYGASGDGKRAEGWRTIEGIPGIHEADETFTFYFKDGAPLFSSTEGNELFTVSGKKYAFNHRGEMQTGQKILNVENGEIANFCFGDDGVMKTGKQTIYNEETGENESWFFLNDGDKKGRGFHGLKDNTLYLYGKRQEASADLRYAPAELNGVSYLINASGSVQRASSSSTSSKKPELGRGHKDFKDANGTVWVVDTEGVIR